MSYDLYFLPDGDAPSREAFERWFAARPKYQLTGNQAFYANEDTGAYCAFELVTPEEDRDPEDPAGEAWATFNLNFGRPRFFVREAVPEIEAFCREFRGRVYDPQDEAHAGRFDAARFTAAWSRTNAFAYGAFAKQGSEQPGVPGDLLDAVWEWNYHRDARAADELFVPKVQFVVHGGRLQTFAVWPGGVPGAIPRTDLALYVKDLPGPDGTVASGGPQEYHLVPFARVEPVLGGRAPKPKPLPHWLSSDGLDEPRWFEFLASLRDPTPREAIQIVNPDGLRDLGTDGGSGGRGAATAKPSFWRRLFGG